MPKRIAAVQSSYIPWKGYFDLIRAVDEFILLDDVQFTKRDWRSRNRIQTRNGMAWLTIPVHTRGRSAQLIEETQIADPGWARRHWQTIQRAYARAPFFEQYAVVVEPLYAGLSSDRLSTVNHSFIATLAKALGIHTSLRWSSGFQPCGGRNERLIDLCKKTGATEYVSGPSARAYLDLGAFARAGIAVRFADYRGYPEYAQLHTPFEHAVSVLDLLFCTGPRAMEYMKDVCSAQSVA
jgi:hypothetical protein